MTEILTESFCERCGTRYTFESAVPSQRRLSGLKVLGRGLKNFVMSDDASLDESIAAARSDIDRDATNHQLDAFHRTFSFCMSCRQYTCANCWNETEARCLSCEPLAIEFPADGTVPEEIDPARLLRFMGENAARTDDGTDVPHEHEQIEAPAAHVHDPWPVEPAARLAWPEGFASSPNGSGKFAPEPPSEAPVLDADAADLDATIADALAANGQAVPVEVDEWAAAEASAEDLTVADTAAPAAHEPMTTPIELEAPSTGVEAGPSAVEASLAEVVSSGAVLADLERAETLELDAAETLASDPADIAAVEGTTQNDHPSDLAEHQTLSDALAAYEAVFVEPKVEAAIDAGQAAPEPEPEPEAIIATPPSEPAAAASPEPVLEPEPVASTPPTPTDQVVQPVWRAPADPASPAPQWPTGPRWPTGIPTGGSPAPQPAPVDQLAALMARTSTEAMWAASSQEILQPAVATPAVAGIRSCGNCGISLSATARFCRRCGTAQG